VADTGRTRHPDLPFLEAQTRARSVIRVARSTRRELRATKLRIWRRVGSLRDTHVQELLSKMDVADLRHIASGLRLAPLGRAGIRTVGQLERTDAARLRAVEGLGAESVQALKAAAAEARSEAEQGFRLRLDPESRPSEQTQILIDLHRFEDLRERLQTLEAAEARIDLGLRYLIGPLGTLLRRLQGWLPLPVSGRIGRDAGRLRTAVGTPEVAAASQLEDQPAGAPDPDGVWGWFEGDAAALYGTLELLGGATPPDTSGGPQSGPSGLKALGRAVGAGLGGRLRAGAGGAPRVRVAGRGDPLRGHLPSALAAAVDAQTLVPVGLNVTLRGYQAFGAKYALLQRRVLLGDEMGLGKTIMALAVMAHLHADGERRFLVIAPNSVLHNWAHEIQRRSALTHHILHGGSRWNQLGHWRSSGGVALTTFDTLRTLQLRSDERIALLVADEAHYLKSPTTQRTRAVRALLPAAQRVLFMTGTPMENRVAEFQGLCQMLQPGLRLELPRIGSTTSSVAFRQAAAPVYLRRNQEDVLRELPERIDIDEWVSFTDDDHARYQQLTRERGGFIPLRHAAYPQPGDGGRSAKLDRLAELVADAAEEGRKVAIYTEFLHVIQAVIGRLEIPVFGPIQGAVSPAERLRIIDDFTRHDGPAAIVAQVRAGGIGLNIQAASVVILCEPALKPSTEEQAIARSYRMGQTRSVRVHRLLSEQGIDPLVRQLLERKTAEFDEYVRPSALADSSVSARDASLTTALKDFAEQEADRLGAA